mmetsp:Transcript_23346/g.37592  ORF Transcript_23346/g.37592 Transcript_23346/m.37592 type:complete len:200 (-) Transcript_23346:1053-1652(-)
MPNSSATARCFFTSTDKYCASGRRPGNLAKRARIFRHVLQKGAWNSTSVTCSLATSCSRLPIDSISVTLAMFELTNSSKVIRPSPSVSTLKMRTSSSSSVLASLKSFAAARSSSRLMSPDPSTSYLSKTSFNALSSAFLSIAYTSSSEGRPTAMNPSISEEAIEVKAGESHRLRPGNPNLPPVSVSLGQPIASSHSLAV